MTIASIEIRSARGRDTMAAVRSAASPPTRVPLPISMGRCDDGKRTCSQSKSHCFDESTCSRIGIDQLLMFGAEMHEHIDESSDLSRQMMPMRIERVHQKLDWMIVRQKAYQAAGLKIVVHQKAGSQANANAFQRCMAQSLAAVG